MSVFGNTLFGNPRNNTVFYSDSVCQGNRVRFNYSTSAKNVDSRIDYALIQMYDEFGKYLEELEHDYALGNINKVVPKLTFEYYSTLADAFKKNEYIYSLGYSKLYNILNLTLQGLYKSTLQHTTCVATIKQLESQIQTLTEPENTMSIFTASAEFGMQVTVAADVKEYILLYGLPPGAIFDVDKLGEIRQKLNMN